MPFYLICSVEHFVCFKGHFFVYYSLPCLLLNIFSVWPALSTASWWACWKCVDTSNWSCFHCYPIEWDSVCFCSLSQRTAKEKTENLYINLVEGTRNFDCNRQLNYVILSGHRSLSTIRFNGYTNPLQHKTFYWEDCTSWGIQKVKV